MPKFRDEPRVPDTATVGPGGVGHIPHIGVPITVITTETERNGPDGYLGTNNLGDHICWVRFLTPLLKRSTSTVSLEVDPRIARLLSRSFPRVIVTKWTDEPWQAPWIPLSQLQTALGIPELDAPAPPYLHADPARVAHYRRLIPPGAVGLCWFAGTGEAKSIPLEQMRPIYERFPCVSLQGGHWRDELSGTPVLDLLEDGVCWSSPDWSEGCAAIITNCRAVVTVHTSVMHLAGALGVDTHMAFVPPPSPAPPRGKFGRHGVPLKPTYWRPMRKIPGEPPAGWNGSWAPMYPTVTGYVGEPGADWGRGVIARIAAALAA